MNKKELTPSEIYEKSSKRARFLEKFAPVCFWCCLALSVLCFVFAVRHSIGNIIEIVTLLDSKKYTGAELASNYGYLTNKFGEWVIGNGSAGFQITFVNIGKALFSGIAIFNLICSVVFLVCAIVVGKWLLPKISKQMIQDNQDMVNMVILKGEKKNKE